MMENDILKVIVSANEIDAICEIGRASCRERV